VFVCVCVCVRTRASSLSYATCPAQVPYYIVNGCIFQHYLTNGRIFGKIFL